MKNRWFKFNPKAEAKRTEVSVYGEIGGSWDGSGVEAESFATDWRAIPKDHEITLRIHSRGGSVWDGLAIYNLIKERKSQVTAHVDGVAFSAASFIAMAAGTIEMPKSARMMIHDASGIEIGNAEDMRRMADMLDQESENIAQIYSDRTGKPVAEIRDMMKATTWMTGSEAKALGFADVVTDEEPKACTFELSCFRRVPDDLRNHANPAGSHGRGTPKDDTMNKKAILALLQKHGKQVANDATDEVILSALDELVNAGKVEKAEAEKLRNAQPPQPPAPKPDDKEDRIVNLEKALKSERDRRIANQYDDLAKTRPALVENRDRFLPRCQADEAFLDDLKAWPEDRGTEPVNMGLRASVGRTEPKEPTNGREACELLGKLSDPVQINRIYNRHRDAIKAHHFTSPRNANSFTTMTYTILAQEALQAFVYGMMPIRAFARNFSSAVVQDGDYVQVPFVASSDAALTFSGTYTMQDVDATGKKVPIDTRKYVSWALTTEELATMPQLNMELFARQKGNALAYAVLQDIWGDITTANFGTDAITDMTGGDERTEAIADFDDETVRMLGAAADLDNWPKMPRSLILGPGYYWTLLGDTTVIGTQGVRATDKNPLEDAQVPNILGFDVYQSNAIPANGQNLAGFAAHPDALLVAMRALVPETGVANRPSVAVLTEPESGMTIVQREWFDADNDRTKRVLECNFGHLVGNPIGAKMIVTS